MSFLFRTLAFAAAFCLASLVQHASAETRRALLIGMKDYAPEVGTLANPHKDVRLMEQTLRDAGFEVEVLMDDSASGVAVDRGDILSAIRRHTEVIADDPSAISFVYYSGHGAANEEDGKNYLIPQAVDSVATADLWDDSVQLETVIERLTNNAPDAAHFVIFDACRNELKLSTTSRALTKGFVAEAERGGVFIAFSTSPAERASDGEPDDTAGPYARVLADQIRQGGTNHVNMFFRTKQIVNEQTGQLPWERSGLVREVYLNGTDGDVITRPAVTDRTEPSGSDTVAAEPEDEFVSLRKAIIVSNSDYVSPFTPLADAHAEADALAEAMQAAGFEVLQLQDPSREVLMIEPIKMLREFEGDALEKLFYFHYIGHVKGLSDEVNRGLSSAGTNYLVTTSAPIQSHFDLAIHGVDLGKMIDRASAVEGLESVFTIDGCRMDTLIAINSTVNCVEEAERENVLITITSIPAAAEAPDEILASEDGSDVPPEVQPTYTARFREELIVGGDITEVVQRTHEKEREVKGWDSYQASGKIDQSYELEPVTQEKLDVAQSLKNMSVTQWTAKNRPDLLLDQKSGVINEPTVIPREQTTTEEPEPASFDLQADSVTQSPVQSPVQQAFPVLPPPASKGDMIAAMVLDPETCFNAVQGKVAWSKTGSTSWGDANVNRLCAGNETSTEPAVCFEGFMQQGWDNGTNPTWQQGVDLCAGATNASARVACAADLGANGITAGVIDLCRAR